MDFKKVIILFFILVFISCTSQHKSEKGLIPVSEKKEITLSGNLSVSGAFALYPLAQKWADEFMKIHKEVWIEVISSGTGEGIKDLLDKKVQLAMISRPLTEEEQDTGIWVLPVVRDGVAPIVNQKNPYLKRILERGISPDKLIKVFTGEKQMTWGELLDTVSKEKVAAFTRADESGAAAIWANFLFKEEKDLKGEKVTGDIEMIKSIRANPLAIGFCNFSYAFEENTGERVENIQAIPIDLDFDHSIDKKEIPFVNITRVHRGLWLGYYPKNLSRELTFGTLGKPTDPLIVEFLRFVLSEGRSAVKKSNFCEMNDVQLQLALETLN